MLFNSIAFLIFLPIVLFLYYVLPHKYRWMLLLVASCYFYGSFIPEYLLILFGIITIDFFAAQGIAKVQDKRKKKRYLVLSILATCSVLFLFKYFNFFSENVNSLASFLGWNYSLGVLKWALPIGLSFHTFQSLSYVIEVYWGRQEPEKNYGIYATYVMFFPQLVAGPIERPQNLLPQFREKHPLLYKNLSIGFRIALLGFFKKMVIADNLATYIDPVFDNPEQYGSNMALLAAYAFTLQIYCDFSGYSDIAIGVARMMGFELMVNFRQPLFASSITDFWRRWHISLSTWFRDYIYIPMGGNRVGTFRLYYNLFIVFMISGIWHGAGWPFVMFGLVHAIWIIVENATRKLRANIKLPAVVSSLGGWFITFHIVVLGFVLFRASDMQNAWDVLGTLSLNMDSFTTQLYTLVDKVHSVNALRVPLLFMVLSMLLFVLIEVVLLKVDIRTIMSRSPKLVRWMGYYFIIAWILLFGVYETTPKFIYFQF